MGSGVEFWVTFKCFVRRRGAGLEAGLGDGVAVDCSFWVLDLDEEGLLESTWLAAFFAALRMRCCSALRAFIADAFS